MEADQSTLELEQAEVYLIYLETCRGRWLYLWTRHNTLCGLPSLLEESVPRGQEIQYHGCIRRYHPRAFFCVPIDLNASLTAKTVASLFDDPASHWLFQLLPSVNFFGENLFGPAQSRVGGGEAYSG